MVTQDKPPRFELMESTGAVEWAATAIFDAISPSVAFINTPMSTGSGVLIDHGYLLTNAHVVWPFEAVRVVFPNGEEHADVPVVGWDMTADLALLGPIETDVPPIGLVDGEGLAIGSDVYLIGYPAEVDAFPQPTITGGILSRVRTWDAVGYTFFQVDATITGGQSGGILVTHGGDVVGISTFYYNEFGMAGSVTDALPRVNALLGWGSVPARTKRPFAVGTPAKEQHDTLRDDRDEGRYVLWPRIGDQVEVTVEGVGRPQIRVLELFGDVVALSEFADPEAQQADVHFRAESAAPHIVEIFQVSTNDNDFDLHSSHMLSPMPDPDDRRELGRASHWIGAIDTPYDIDSFSVFLEEGDSVEIIADSLMVDTALSLTFYSGVLAERIEDDDSGGGVFGRNAKLVYTAPMSGIYDLWVYGQAAGYEMGNYVLTVMRVDEDAVATQGVDSRTLIATEFGSMEWYEQGDYAIMRPFYWADISPEECALDIDACYVYGNVMMLIIEDSLSFLPRRERNRQGYLAAITDFLDFNGLEMLIDEERRTIQDLTVTRLKLSAPGDRSLGERLIYVDETAQTAFNVAFSYPPDEADAIVPMIDFIFDSLRVWRDGTSREESAVHFLDEGLKMASAGDLEAARAAYDRSIELDAELAEAYAQRAWLLHELGDDDAALADAEHALALEPQRAVRMFDLATIAWILGKPDLARRQIDQALETGPAFAAYHVLRALLLAESGDFDAALADMDAAVSLNFDELDAYLQGNRAYVYLLKDEPELAQADYDAVLAQDVRSPEVLLGAGIAYAQLGDANQAADLLREGRFLLDIYAPEELNPQLRALLAMADAATAPD
ncbi:MAG: trypsin-like peptidase domain-containing protein [Caldilineaceae bacterium]|nr:trypsin-like peptidase domain-containing protein [Caldilineaceae bacterium]